MPTEAQIRAAFKRVPWLAKGPRYVPLHQLPKGTMLRCKTDTEEFEVIIGDCWPTIFLHGPPSVNKSTLAVKPFMDLIAPGTDFQVNYFDQNENHDLTITGIRSILVVDTKIQLFDKDLPRAKTRRVKKRKSPLPLRLRKRC